MQDLRLGIIGLGNMGQVHAESVRGGKIARCRLAAVCDPDCELLKHYSGARPFLQSSELIKSGEVDAVLIATPHYSHAPIGIQTLEAGLHVLVEKPLCVHKADCERLISVPLSPGQV
ncbi:MAG TPA: Gfo/Idh/MocA family oxidoreductase, partial [Terrimicrobiaceae bacterium]|nr:Gfo/Idh/MocA family oxidoreductase [Terrimicrobiaceae bacterium]